jgi:hypothetical protein
VKKILYILLFALGLVACGTKEEASAPPVNSDILSEEQMIDVLIDLHIEEASLTLNMIQNDRALADSARYYNIYKVHNTTREQFDESFHYYAGEPEKLNAIYDTVLKRLNTMQTEAMKKSPPDTSKVKLPPGSKMPHPH